MALKIVVLRGKRAGSEIELDDGRSVFVLGSAPEADVRLEDEGVLPQHARIFKDEARFILMDVSGAGVRVNGRAEVTTELRAGDELGLGAAILRVTPAAVPLTAALQRPPSPMTVGSGAELRIVKGPDEGKTFGLGAKATLGRGVNVDVALLDMKCSREHCTIERRAEGWVLVDLGSTNGTRLNDIKLDTRGVQVLKHGDKLRLGGTLVEFRCGVQATVARPLPDVLKPPTPARPKRVFEIDLESLNAPPIPVQANDAPSREALTAKMRSPSDSQRLRAAQTMTGEPGVPAALQGNLEKMGFAQVVQFLNISQKTGELLVFGPTGELGVAFHEGRVCDAWGIEGALSPEQHFYGIARLRRGHFQFHENTPPREARIRQGTLALLMEAMRLVDEATDPGD